MPIVNSRMTSGTFVVFHRNAASGLGLGLGCAVFIVVIVLRVWVHCVRIMATAEEATFQLST